MAGQIDPTLLGELGQTGLIRFGGFVFEEFLKELQGTKGMAIYREMGDNDPTVAAALFAFDQLCRNVEWRVDPGGKSPEDLGRAEFLKRCMDDMSATWNDTISEMLSCIRFGFSWHEQVFKQCLGATPGMDDKGEPLPISKYDDGLMGWRRLPIRAQETMWNWDFAENGAIKAMIQRAPPRFVAVKLPIAKSLLFRHRSHKNNPEGVSALRGAYRPWYFKKKLEVVEAIGIERELAGLPMVEVPPEMLMEDASPEDKQILNYFKKLVTNIRNDEQGGIVMPMAFDDDKNPIYRLSLLTTGGRRAIDTNVVIQRHDEKIAQTLLADLILIGNSGHGSYALMETKVDLFTQAITGWLDSIAEVLNRHAAPTLFEVNGMSTENMPRFAHGPVNAPDLKDLGDFINSIASVGAFTPTPADEGYLREVANLPASLDEEAAMGMGKRFIGGRVVFAKALLKFLKGAA